MLDDKKGDSLEDRQKHERLSMLYRMHCGLPTDRCLSISDSHTRGPSKFFQEKNRWACLGAGKISSDFFLAMRENLPREDHELVAIAAQDLKRAQEFADKLNFKRAYGSYDEVAADPDVEVVYIGTIHSNHAELSKKMLAAGKHVLCEKPMAINWKQGKQVIDMARKSNLFFAESYDYSRFTAMFHKWYRGPYTDRTHICNFELHQKPGSEAMWSRCFPVYDKIRQELKDGILGNVKLVKADLCLPNAHVERIRKHELHGGGLLDLGIYPIMFACMVYGDMPEHIVAVGNTTQTGIDENACILMKYKNGSMASLTYHTDAGLGPNTGIIMGQKGLMEIGRHFGSPTKIATPTGMYEFPLKEGDYYYRNSAGLHYEAAVVRKCIQEGKRESELLPHSQNEMILKIMDEVRRQLGVRFAEDDD